MASGHNSVVPTAAELGTPEDIDSTLTTLISWYASTDSEADAEQATPEDPIAKVPIHYGGAITTDSEADDELATPESVAAEEPVRCPGGLGSPDSAALAMPKSPEQLA